MNPFVPPSALPVPAVPAPVPAPGPAGPPILEDSLTKVFVAAIPTGTDDYFMKKILSTCGPIKSWDRAVDPKGNRKGFGFAVYQTPEGVLRALRVLSTEHPDNTLLNRSPDFDGIELPGNPPKKLRLSVDDTVRALITDFAQRFPQDIEEKDKESWQALLELLPSSVHAADAFLSTIMTKENSEPRPDIKRKRERRFNPKDEEDSSEEKKKIERRKRELIEAFLAKERRWEAHEVARDRKLKREQERWSGSTEEQDIQMKRLASFDDDQARHYDDFYRDRKRWIERRQAILRREMDMDEKDRLAEQEEALHPQVEEPEEKKEIPIVPQVEDKVVGRILTVEERQAKMKEIISQIPEDQEGLWAWEMKWDLLNEVIVGHG
jgi:RNA recognition motif-containing protein